MASLTSVQTRGGDHTVNHIFNLFIYLFFYYLSLGERSEPHTRLFNRDFTFMIYVGMSTKKILMPKMCGVELRGPNTRMLKVRFGRLKTTCDTRSIHFDYKLEQLLAWTKNKMFT